MTRTTDDLQDKEPFRPFGEKVNRAPPDLRPEWVPLEGSPGIYQNREGKLRTDQPLPIVPPTRVP